MNRSPTARAPDEPPAALEDLGDPRSDALVDAHGTGYQSFRTTLRPRWLRVWADILLGYLALALVAGGSLAASGLAWPWQCAVALACAAAFGYWMAYLQLFLHEAAHFNIAASRRWNDRLANLLVAGWTGTAIAAYRIIHWEHHRFHGQPNDAEHSVLAWCRASEGGEDVVACVANLTPVVRERYRVGLPRAGAWREVINTDSTFYGGSDVGNTGVVQAEPIAWHGQPFSAEIVLPPLAVLWLAPGTG